MDYKVILLKKNYEKISLNYLHLIKCLLHIQLYLSTWLATNIDLGASYIVACGLQKTPCRIYKRICLFFWGCKELFGMTWCAFPYPLRADTPLSLSPFGDNFYYLSVTENHDQFECWESWDVSGWRSHCFVAWSEGELIVVWALMNKRRMGPTPLLSLNSRQVTAILQTTTLLHYALTTITSLSTFFRQGLNCSYFLLIDVINDIILKLIYVLHIIVGLGPSTWLNR